jgi:hypothetical protein
MAKVEPPINLIILLLPLLRFPFQLVRSISCGRIDLLFLPATTEIGGERQSDVDLDHLPATSACGP